MREPVDRYSDTLVIVVRALLRSDRQAATAAMSEIAFEPPYTPAGYRPGLRQLAEIYERDRYQCRYCGIRTINSGVLALLSWAFPTELPVHPNWRAEATHPVYVLRFTEPVKIFWTRSCQLFCSGAGSLGGLIHATVGSLGGSGV